MKDKTLLGGLIVMGVGAVLIGVVWVLFLQPSRTPTAPLTAVPITIEGNPDEFTIFEIQTAESEVTFSLDELLRGLPTMAVGRSQQVAGQIAVNFDAPENSQIGPIVINARTLRTDNEFRDNAIHGFILDTEAHEFITFTPTQINGLPEQFVSNEPIVVEIVGNLTIREIEQPVVFEGTVTANGRAQLTGSATSRIDRNVFQLEIPEAPGVADVSEQVSLTIKFFAEPAKSGVNRQ
ncbi:YceI family protein [Candidatus Leptofilum sp.]|uniref:YceI family protein n=1 Tax=Candidatus Leptofilum sp. TaxID=3241576 RepID=UPI003B5A8946